MPGNIPYRVPLPLAHLCVVLPAVAAEEHPARVGKVERLSSVARAVKRPYGLKELAVRFTPYRAPITVEVALRRLKARVPADEATQVGTCVGTSLPYSSGT
mgnify:CR=1 FL=1